MKTSYGHKVILFGLAGSKAYGLDTPESDEDMRGVFVTPTRNILGLGKYRGPETVDDVQHETVFHEVEKFVRLALAGNPSIIEQLYLDDYRELTAEGSLLVGQRKAFLSQRVRKTYGGYAIQQMKRLERRERDGMVGFGPKTSKRREKHARHLARLCQQGTQLLLDSDLNVRVTNRDELFTIGRMDTPMLKAWFELAMSRLDQINSGLPMEPDYKTVNELLLEIRRLNP